MSGGGRPPERPHRQAWAILALGAALLVFRWAVGQLPAWRMSIGGMEIGDVLIYCVAPALLLPLLGENPLTYLRVGRVRAIRWALCGALAVVALSAYLLAHHAPFRRYYATGTPSGRYVLQSLLTVACIEFFFRGVLVQRPFRAFGWPAILWSTVLYGLIHLGKPNAELAGSFVFGAGLTYLAVQSGSIWYGVLLHWLLAVGAVSLIAAAQ